MRQRLRLSQAAFGEKLEYSAMAVSRWERGAKEPPADCYIQLGNLAGSEGCWYFWERAGFKSSDLARVLPEGRRQSVKSIFPQFDIVVAGSGKKRRPTKKTKLVAIPVLNVHAGSLGNSGDKVVELDQVPADEMIAAPALWCPNPAYTSCLRVRGNSMGPLIYDGDVLAVDYSQTDRSELDGKIVVASHAESGLSVSRFRQYRNMQFLEPENRDYESVDLRKNRNWRILGKALWWIRRAP